MVHPNLNWEIWGSGSYDQMIIPNNKYFIFDVIKKTDASITVPFYSLINEFYELKCDERKDYPVELWKTKDGEMKARSLVYKEPLPSETFEAIESHCQKSTLFIFDSSTLDQAFGNYSDQILENFKKLQTIEAVQI